MADDPALAVGAPTAARRNGETQQAATRTEGMNQSLMNRGCQQQQDSPVRGQPR